MARSNSNPDVFTSLFNAPTFPRAEEALAVLARLFDFTVPEGYQNESGFHFSADRSTGNQSSTGDYNRLGEEI